MGSFLGNQGKSQSWLYTVGHASTTRKTQIHFIFSVYVCMARVVWQRDNHTFITIVRHSPHSWCVLLPASGWIWPARSLLTFLCVYVDRNKQQPQHSWMIMNVLAHFNVFLFLPDIVIYMYIYLYWLLPDLIPKAVKTSLPLSLPGWTFWRLVCQTISCPRFWDKKKQQTVSIYILQH